MMFFKVETHARARKSKPRYYQMESWEALLSHLSIKRAPSADWESQEQWHTLKIRTISEAEYIKHTSPRR